ncbi:MAG: SH3 domain-containing protein [Vicinamibacterales bacterium]
MTTRPFVLGLTLALFFVPGGAGGQAPLEQVRVPERQANTNVHMGPSSAQPVLVLAPKGTVFPVVKRQGEWFLVRLAPDLRKLGTPMRWYQDETEGWVHDSTVEAVQARPGPSKKP